jgi:hypothetical protein
LPRRTVRSAAVFIASVAALALAGCGGGGGGSTGNSHTYVITPSEQNGLAKGIYVTIVSPVAIPTKLLTFGGSTVVSGASGPQKCAYTKTVQGTHGPGAFLRGKQITLKVNGTNPLVGLVCSTLKTTPFKASNLAGG